MKILTIAGRKGGSAKTTTTVSLAGALAEAGRRVLVADLDPQGSATDWLAGRVGAPLDDFGDRPARVLEGSLPVEDALVRTGHGIDLLPANGSLSVVARLLLGEADGQRSLLAALRQLPRSRYDFVLVDTPPEAGFLANAALVAADQIVIPAEARHLGLHGPVRVLARVQRMSRYGEPVPIAAILVCRLDRRTNQGPDVAAQLRAFAAQEVPGVPLLDVREAVALSEAAAAHQPITVFAPRSRGAEDYRRVADLLLEA
jgi:chromosome partitioning protein